MPKLPPQLGRYSRGFKEAVNDIDLILVESTVVKEALSAELNKKIECIPHYLPYQKQNVRESEYSNYFLFTGQLETRKGILNLLETFRRYSNKIDAKLIITGRGSLEKQIRDFIVKHSLQSKILFLGWVNREVLWSLYKGALAVIVPSIVPDPGPMVVVEALSVGTPVIGSYQAGYIRDVISKVDNGLAFNGGDVESLGKLLIHFRKEDYPPKKVKDICLKWFSVERYVSRYLDVLDNMMATN